MILMPLLPFYCFLMMISAPFAWYWVRSCGGEYAARKVVERGGEPLWYRLLSHSPSRWYVWDKKNNYWKFVGGQH